MDCLKKKKKNGGKTAKGTEQIGELGGRVEHTDIQVESGMYEVEF